MQKMTSYLLTLLSLSVIAINTGSLAMAQMCKLECSNGGYCTLLPKTPAQLSRDVQGGFLIETCVCQPGYGGVGCELKIEECTYPDFKCHNGLPCRENAEGEWKCDCAMAEEMSPFAGEMCRRPYTEYCSGRFQGKEAARSFCTNGGRCRADFIAADIAPGDTAVNKAYQHAGCSCPPEFNGPHCEFVAVKDYVPKMGDMYMMPTTEEVEEEEMELQSTKIGILLAIVVICFILAAAIVFRLRRRHRARLRRQRYDDDSISSTSSDDDNDKYHKKHIGYESPSVPMTQHSKSYEDGEHYVGPEDSPVKLYEVSLAPRSGTSSNSRHLV